MFFALLLQLSGSDSEVLELVHTGSESKNEEGTPAEVIDSMLAGGRFSIELVGDSNCKWWNGIQCQKQSNIQTED